MQGNVLYIVNLPRFCFLNSCFSKLAEEYGTDVASEMLARSRSNLNLNASLSSMEVMPTMPYATPQPKYHARYDSLGVKSPGLPFSAS